MLGAAAEHAFRSELDRGTAQPCVAVVNIDAVALADQPGVRWRARVGMLDLAEDDDILALEVRADPDRQLGVPSEALVRPWRGGDPGLRRESR